MFYWNQLLICIIDGMVMSFRIQLWKCYSHCYVRSIHMQLKWFIPFWCHQNRNIWNYILELLKNINRLFFLHNLWPVFEKFSEVICLGCIPLDEPSVITRLPQKCSQLSLWLGKWKTIHLFNLGAIYANPILWNNVAK